MTNATIVRKAYDDFADGDIPAVLQAFDTSIIWHVPGHSPLSGDYKGPDEIVGFFKHTSALCGGTFAIEVQHVLAEEDVVVALVTVKAERNGRPAAFPEVHVWRLVNEKITEFREFQGDEQTEDRFWSYRTLLGGATVADSREALDTSVLPHRLTAVRLAASDGVAERKCLEP